MSAAAAAASVAVPSAEDNNNNNNNINEDLAPPIAGENPDDEAQPTYFVEKQEVVDIVRFLCEALPKAAAAAGATPSTHHEVIIPQDSEIAHKIARFEKVVGQYQELSQLLKPHLEDFAEPLIALFASMLPKNTESLQQLLVKQQQQQQQQQTMATQQSSSSSCSFASSPAAKQKKQQAGDDDRSMMNNNTSSSVDDMNSAAAAAALTVDNRLGQDFEEFEVDAARTAWHNAARLACFVCKVVGFKSVIGHFPHEVRMLEPCFHALQHWMRSPGARAEWEIRYGLLLWLSNLVLAPFALNQIDSSASTGSLSSSLLECALTFLGDASKCREGAALFIGRLLTRPDAEAHRSRLMREAIVEMSVLASTGVSSHVRAGGVLHAAAITFKTGNREELVGFARMLIPIVAPVTLKSGDARVCKTATKLLQRLGLALLPNRPQPWRYNKARTAFLGSDLHLQQAAASASASSSQNQTIAANAAGAAASPSLNEKEHDKNTTTTTTAKKKGGEDEDEEPLSLAYLQQVEEVVDVLIQALGHSDTMVRYSAAKGIGRICERLPRDCADDIVNALFDDDSGPFSVRENDSNWHGATLAIAEICRRYALLPARFSQVVPLVQKALQYDVCKGSYSVGSHVRDAASYICWAAARSYNLDDLADYVFPLSRALVTTALTDREVNVRRAASAAFQECAGRLGNFPHALDIITTVDFFALANLRHALLEVAPKIAWIAEYRDALFDRLLEDRIEHWSKEVREVSAASLGLLCNYMVGKDYHLLPVASPATTPAGTATASDDNAADVARRIESRRKLIVETVVPRLCKQALESTSVNVRHGSVAALAEIVGRFDPFIIPGSASSNSNNNKSGASVEHYCKTLGGTLISLLPHLEAKRLFRGRGAEYLRQVCCKLIENISRARTIALPDKIQRPGLRAMEDVSMRATVQAFFEETCKNPLRWLQQDGASAMLEFGRQFYQSYNNAFHSGLVSRLVQSVVGAGKTPNERRGGCLMLGALPASVLCATAASKPAEAGAAADPQLQASASPSFVIFDKAVDILSKAAAVSSASSPVQQSAPLTSTQPTAVASATNTSSSGGEAEDAECREEAIRALGRCCVTVLSVASSPASLLTPELKKGAVALFTAKRDSVVEPAFLAAVEDYAADRRGDIGLYVRLAAIESQREVVEAALLAPTPASSSAEQMIVTADFIVRFVCSCLKQSMEKIDRVRTVATKQLHQFLTSTPSVTAESSSARLSDAIVSVLKQQQLLDDFATLARVFTAVPPDHDWAQPAAAFDLIVPNLAGCGTFLPSIVDGLCSSAGCLTPHVAQSALAAMVSATTSTTNSNSNNNYNNNNSPNKIVQQSMAAAFKSSTVFGRYQQSERMAVPVLVATERALEAGVVADADLLAAAIDQCIETMRCFAKDIQRLLALVPVMASLGRRCSQYTTTTTSSGSSSAPLATTCSPPSHSFEQHRIKCWQVLVTLLASRFPKVRALCSVEIFTMLAALRDSSQHQRAQELLSTTQWDTVAAAELKAAGSGVRAKIFDALQLPPLNDALAEELEAAGTGPARAKKQVSELAMYKTLVAEKGF